MKTEETRDKVPANNIEKVLNSYLEIETNYALLINGSRGIGKTFFVKNKILPQIEKLKVQHDQRKFYKPIYISLYGLNSIDEVYTLFAFELLPFLKSNTAKVTLGIGKMLTRGLLSYNRAGNIDDFFKDISNTSKSALDTREFVIIFDDLDRLSSKISINEFIGFVNSLVEHDNNKIIIIADQVKIDDQDIYKAVREKTIGTVIEYTSTFDETFEQIILGTYKKAGFPDYYNYLNVLKPLILDLFQKTNSYNLRTLIYFLQHFSKIFHDVFYDLDLDKEEPGEINLIKLNIIVRFALAVSIEFKNGHLSYTDMQGVDLVDEINAIIHNEWLKETFADNIHRLNGPVDKKQKAIEPEKSYKEQFIAKYYDKGIYHFYKPVYDFITGGNDFEKVPLLFELKKNVDDRRHKVYRQDEVFKQLSYPEVYDLTNDELRKLSKELYDFALNGQFSLDHYLSVFHYMERFPNILKYDPADVSEKLIAAINEHAAQFQYVPMLEHYFGVKSDQPNHAYFLKLFRELIKVNKQINKQIAKQNDVTLFGTFKDNPDVFYKAVNENYHEELFSNWNFDDFYTQFEHMGNNQLRMFISFLENRYQGYESAKSTETEFFAALYEKTTKKGEGEETLRDYILEDLQEILKNILKAAQPVVS